MRLLAANDSMTQDALCVLGVAFRTEKDVHSLQEDLKTDELERDLVFVGLIGMIDPAHPEVKPALMEAGDAGIRTLMITGDYPNTDRTIAETIGLLQPVIKYPPELSWIGWMMKPSGVKSGIRMYLPVSHLSIKCV